MTNYPHGVASFGIPVLPGIQYPAIPGASVVYVRSGTGKDWSGAGSFERPFASIKYALTQVTEYGTILVLPGHVETIDASTYKIGVDDVRIIGLGYGNSRGFVGFSATTGKIEVTAANVLISNLIINTAEPNGHTTGIEVSGEGFHFIGNKVICGITSAFGTNAISLLVGAEDAVVSNNRFQSTHTTNGSRPFYVGAIVSGWTFSDNICQGPAPNAHCYNTQGVNRVVIQRNLFRNTHASGIGISLHSSTNGLVSDNVTMVSADVAAGGTISAAAAVKARNEGGEIAHISGSTQIDPPAGGFA